jgi:hypothetical protein
MSRLPRERAAENIRQDTMRLTFAHDWWLGARTIRDNLRVFKV